MAMRVDGWEVPIPNQCRSHPSAAGLMVRVLHWSGFRRMADAPTAACLRLTEMPGSLPVGVDVLALVRRYEPVVRYTAGELFLPMSVDTYIRGAALWAIDPATERSLTLVADHGQLDLERLCAQSKALPNAKLQLRYVPGSLGRRQLRRWRRDPDRPRFRSTTRHAAVGLFGRVIDAVFRFSLLLRGRVPGGLTAAAHQKYRAAATDTHPYYAHVTTDGGYVVVQYWFLYAMNDWRSSFAGVNDHEADWEQVTIYLASAGEATAVPDGAEQLRPVWVAFSSHDEVGADVRRRSDDPDLTWFDGTHPVVHAGAGSHSGAYLAGEYLVRVEPPALARLFGAFAHGRGLLFPWTRGRPRTGLAIPYVDYKRGDGSQVGPGTARPWTAVLIDDGTSWVRDFTGLWGLDTHDPFGGERAPAGPRYNRDGSIRECWSDPVAWAGLDEVPATPAERSTVAAERLADVEHRREQLEAEVTAQQKVVRRLASARATPLMNAGRGRTGSEFEAQTTRLRDLRATRRTLLAELDSLRREQDHRVDVAPHAHLRRRAVPEVGLRAEPGLLLRVWTEASLSVLLALLGVALLLNLASAPIVVLAAILTVMLVEAVLRRRLLVFLLGLLVVTVLTLAVWLFVTNWRVGLGALALVASFTLALANLRSLLARR